MGIARLLTRVWRGLSSLESAFHPLQTLTVRACERYVGSTAERRVMHPERIEDLTKVRVG